MALSSSSARSMEESVRKTLQDLQVRSQVEACVQDLLHDVEVAERLTERVQHTCLVQDLIQQGQSQALALEEERLLRQETRATHKKLADSLVAELWTVSTKLGEYQQLQTAHAELSEEYDSMVAKLLHAQDEIEELREQRQNAAVPTATTTTAPANTAVKETPSSTVEEKETTGTTLAESAEIAQPESTNEIKPVASKEETKSETDESLPVVLEKEEEKEKDDEKVETAEVPLVVNEQPQPQEQQEQSQQPQQDAAVEPVVALLEEDDEDDPVPALYELETSILMNIFGFLDALDILNTAQVNISMYSTVDSIFGLGADPVAASDNSTIATNEDQSSVAAAAAAAAAPAPAAAASTATTSVSTMTMSSSGSGTTAIIPSSSSPSTPRATIARPSSTTAASAAVTQPQPTKVVIPPATTTTATTATTASTSSFGKNSNLGVFGFLQSSTRKPAASTTTTTAAAAAAAAAATSSTPSTSSNRSATSPPRRPGATYEAGSSKNAPPMNAAMANSMAAKLSDSELNAIILMTERLKQNEKMAERLKQENEKLRASLDGTEAVKQFLINKVREMEESLTVQENNETKVAQQIASDQEVIAFLDARIQQLERESVVAKEAQKAAEAEVGRIKEQTNKKASVLQDILQFEREKCSEQEREWKATKKLLVKEVKNCRAQIAKLMAERDGYREHNESLLQFGSGGGGSVGYSP